MNDRSMNDQLSRKPFFSTFFNLVILTALVLVILFSVSLVMRRKGGDREDSGRAGDFKVEVLNGCGETGVAEMFRRVLVEKGFDVVVVSNAESFDYPVTLVKDRCGNPAYARAVSGALGGVPVIRAEDTTRLLEVTVIVGRDYRSILLRPGETLWSRLGKFLPFLKRR